MDGGDGGRAQPFSMRVLSHSTCESLMGGLEGVTGLMRLTEEHSLVGWLVASDRAHRGPRTINLRSQPKPTHRMEVHVGPVPNTNTHCNTSAGQGALILYKLYKGAGVRLADICVYNWNISGIK